MTESRQNFRGAAPLCDNHFLRDAAKPVLDADSHAKVQCGRCVAEGYERSFCTMRRDQRIAHCPRI